MCCFYLCQQCQGQSILDSASSIDAHIDAGALIDRISGGEPKRIAFFFAETVVLFYRVMPSVSWR